MATAVSACFVRAGKVGGAEYALYNLLDGLRSVTATDPWTVVSAQELEPGFDLAPLRQRLIHVPLARNRVVLESVGLPPIRDIDRWLLPNYFTPAGIRGRVVTIIHDAQYAHFPENFSPLKRAWLRAAHRHTMRRADTVVAISQFVADDLVRLHGARFATKIKVIPNAVSFSRLEPGELPAGIPPDSEVVLCVAGGYRHKNLETLVRAFAIVAARRPDSYLVLVGPAPHDLIGARPGTDVAVVVQALQLASRVKILGHVTNAELGALYRRAAVVVMPSLFEGFGLPVIEALGLGVPVVSSRRGALEEVSLGLARYVDDPLSANELGAAVLHVLADGDAARPGALEVASVQARYEPSAIAARYRNVVMA